MQSELPARLRSRPSAFAQKYQARGARSPIPFLKSDERQPQNRRLRADFAAIVAHVGRVSRRGAVFRVGLAPGEDTTAYSCIPPRRVRTPRPTSALLRDQGHGVSSPRQAFQQAFATGWISDEQIWDDIIPARNTAVHVYREADAERLFSELRPFQSAFDQLARSLPGA